LVLVVSSLPRRTATAAPPPPNQDAIQPSQEQSEEMKSSSIGKASVWTRGEFAERGVDVASPRVKTGFAGSPELSLFRR
jgi:hypothetical protein